MLFYRERVAELLGAGHALPVWPDDGVLRAVFSIVLGVTFILAARRCDPGTLLRQPLLLAFLAFSLASVTWSIEPGVSTWRVTLFLGTAVAGWYVGERFTVKEIVGMVGAVGAIGALSSVVALLAWSDKASSTNRIEGIWSGAYVNRNLLGLVMGYGLLALAFMWTTLPRKRRPFLIVLAALEVFLLVKSQSRTPLIALGASAAVAVPLIAVRRATWRALKPGPGAFAVSLVAGYVAILVQWNWSTVLGLLNRSNNLSKRTVMWGVDRYYLRMQPLKGWGFEAIWTHPPTIAVAQTVYGTFPYSSHSGFYEILLSTGWMGFGLFAGFLGVSAWRAFRFAWESGEAVDLWPLAFFVFAGVENLSESMWVSSEATWALTVAGAVAVSRRRGQRQTVS